MKKEVIKGVRAFLIASFILVTEFLCAFFKIFFPYDVE